MVLAGCFDICLSLGFDCYKQQHLNMLKILLKEAFHFRGNSDYSIVNVDPACRLNTCRKTVPVLINAIMTVEQLTKMLKIKMELVVVMLI